MTAPTLRPYQVEAIAAARERFRSGDRGTLIVLPTGTGKTVVFAEVARLTVERGRRVLVLAHRSELLTQAIAKLRAVGVDAALEQGPNRAGSANVVVASVATLKSKRLAAWSPDAFGVIVIDEAHHATAASYRKIVDHFASAKILGVTATPDRADGIGLDSLFGSRACYVLELRAAIAAGYLVPIRARSIRVDVDLDGIKRSRGDFDVGELSDAMTEAAVLDASARALLAERGHRPTVAFTVDVEHARKLAEAINAHRPGLAVHVSGKSTDEQRKAAADGLIAGSIGIVCNAALWTEGFDCPPVACVAIYRPTGSRGLFAQMIGRGTRPSPATGETDVLVLDFAGTTKRHRLVSAADVLEGDLPDDVAELVVEELRAEGGGDVEAAITRARAAGGRARRTDRALAHVGGRRPARRGRRHAPLRRRVRRGDARAARRAQDARVPAHPARVHEPRRGQGDRGAREPPAPRPVHVQASLVAPRSRRVAGRDPAHDVDRGECGARAARRRQARRGPRPAAARSRDR